MAGITQTIPSFTGGISEQPDNLKFPGQVSDVVNGIPDITKGLFKRPGAQRVDTIRKTPLANVYTNQSHLTNKNGSWFHYHRDKEEGSYIGQVDINGQVRVWKADGDNAGQEQNVVYGSSAGTNYVSGTKEKAYLATTDPENLQFLTINDSTFVTNRDSNKQECEVQFDSFTTVFEMTSSTVVTITQAGLASYGLAVGDKVSLDFSASSVSGKPDTGIYTISAITDHQFTATVTGGTNAAVDTNLTCRVTKVTPTAPHPHFAFVELLRSENGRQYGLNVYSTVNNPQTLTRATKIKIVGHSFDEGDGSGHCPGIGTEVYSVTAAATYDTTANITHVKNAAGTTLTSGKDNLIFRITALGQQGISPNYNANANGAGGSNYRCSYNIEATLLHGGEGWVAGDVIRVNPEHATTADASDSQAFVTVQVTESEEITAFATMSSGGDGFVRPTPTPFDADTAVTADTILGGIKAELDAVPNISCTIIGSGIYIFSETTPFNVTVAEEDLMRVMHSSINDVTNLPNQCKHGYIVKISNTRMAEEDDYYLKFEGKNDKDGDGSWVECAQPGLPTRLNNLPLVIQRTSLANGGTNTEIATFTVKEFTYAERQIGDELSNPTPSFVGKRINKVLFFRNRLVFLAGGNVILSRPGSIANPDFFSETALTVSASDPIDISSASTFPSELFDAIETTTGLLVFSTNQQFLLSSDDTVLNPDTAKLRSVSTFNYNKTVPPISLGTTVAYIDNSGKFSRFNEMANIRREGEPSVVEVSKVVPTLLDKNLDLLTNSRENGMVLLAKTGSPTVFGYRYFQVAEQRQQAAWFKWKFNNSLIYHFIIDDTYFFLDEDYHLQKIRLVKSDDDFIATDDNLVDYLLHLDNFSTIKDGVYDATLNRTTFSSVNWLTTVTTPAYTLIIIDKNGRYAPVTYNTVSSSNNTASATSFTVAGNWENSERPDGEDYKIGYIYDYEVKLPTLYPSKQTGDKNVYDVNSSLVLHRLKFHFGKVGAYQTILTRVGKRDFTQQHESALLSLYEAGQIPYLPEFIKTVPVYERNVNVEITLKSTHPSPATLHAISWEGDYSPRFYKRV